MGFGGPENFPEVIIYIKVHVYAIFLECKNFFPGLKWLLSRGRPVNMSKMLKMLNTLEKIKSFETVSIQIASDYLQLSDCPNFRNDW